MGLNDEYSRDAYQGEQYAYDSDGSDDYDPELHPEDWQDMYSEDLMDAWNFVLEFMHDNFMGRKPNCTYPKFVDLVVNPTQYPPIREPITAMRDLWARVRRVRVVRERVQPEQFYTWADTYVF
jgi:hypothetical protein